MSIFIFRRDLRIKDNTAWNKMIEDKPSHIYPIFIFTPEQIDNNTYKSDNSVQFMIESLIELKKEINLTLCYGEIEEVINNIINNNNIDSIYTNTDYTPYSIKREQRMEKICKHHNIKFNYYHDITLFEPLSIKNATGGIFQKFTPFYITCMKKIKKINKSYTKTSHNTKYIKTNYSIGKKELDTFYSYNNNIHVHGGRNNALKIFNHIDNFKTYEKKHNMLSINTTNLSAYLKFGCVSIREVFYLFIDYFGKTDPLVRQLIWREFYYHLGNGFINRFGKSLKPQYNKIKWVNNMNHFNKWKKGMTGYPIVDACMMQLNTTGYMHNRGRLIVASFLIKNLMIDWRYGEKYFAKKLVDYDVYVNQGNWQWVSGSGADSQPYFRVFNPSLQSENYDKDALYIKHWLPNLKDVDNKHLHKWETYYIEYDLHKIKYYKPIISYTDSKKKALMMYKKYL
jgi:deoxyribodipyrimidine photo-lyase